MLLGPIERQIEFGQSRRSELDGLPALQDRFKPAAGSRSSARSDASQRCQRPESIGGLRRFECGGSIRSVKFLRDNTEAPSQPSVIIYSGEALSSR